MTDEKEIKQELKEIRKYAKENGIKITSCFNRQDSMESSRINNRIFALKTNLKLLSNK